MAVTGPPPGMYLSAQQGETAEIDPPGDSSFTAVDSVKNVVAYTGKYPCCIDRCGTPGDGFSRTWMAQQGGTDQNDGKAWIIAVRHHGSHDMT